MAVISYEYKTVYSDYQELDTKSTREGKSISGTTVRSEECHESSNGDDNIQAQWHPGVKAQFPWEGVGSLLTIMVCMALTVVILTTSDGKAREEWPAYQKWSWINSEWKRKVQLTPSTALAAVNTVSNLALALAIGNGVTIAWWRKAVRGSTVGELHNSLEFSNSVFQIATAGKDFNLIALCALAAKFALVDNIFLQRAASDIPGTFQQSVTNLQLPIVQQLPADYAGVFSSDGSSGYLSDAFSANLFNYATSSGAISFDELWGMMSDITPGFNTHCTGVCDTFVQAFGVNVTCGVDTTQASDISPESVASSSNIGNSSSDDVALTTLLDTSYTTMTAGSNYPDPWIQMSVNYAILSETMTYDSNGSIDALDPQSCTTEIITHTCSIRPAILNYPIRITNLSTSLMTNMNDGIVITQNPTFQMSQFMAADGSGPPDNGQIWGIEVTDSAYQTNSSLYNNNMQAIYQFLYNTFRANVTLGYLNGTGYIAQSESSPMAQWWTTSQSTTSLPEGCGLTVADPTPWLVQQLNSVLFRAAITAAVNQTDKIAIDSQTVSNIVGTQTINTVIYDSEYMFMGAAVATMLLCVMCILPAYWGFWELGRKVTLDPIEIASAFRAPVLESHIDSVGGDMDSLIKEVGERLVKYGEIQGTGRLAMVDPTNEDIMLTTLEDRYRDRHSYDFPV